MYMEFKNDLIGKFLQILHLAIPLLRTKLPYWIDEVDIGNWVSYKNYEQMENILCS